MTSAVVDAKAGAPRADSLLERVGTAALLRWQARAAPELGPRDAPEVHLLDDKERAAVQSIERAALARAAMAGVLSALVCAVAEHVVLDAEHTAPLLYWAVVAVSSGVAAVGEIAFLSWDALRTAHRLALATGAELDDESERRELIAVLVRAALELPNPIDRRLGIDPLRETPRLVVVLAGLVYKLKVSATNIVLKQLVRRSFGRAGVRAVLPYLAIPGTALWNVVVAWLVLRELRVRIFGPSLVRDVVDRLLPPGTAVSPRLAEACLRAVGACVVKTADLHPNLAALFVAAERRAGVRVEGADDVGKLLSALDGLPHAERDVALGFLRTAAVIDGRLKRKERALLVDVHARVGAPLDLDDVERERRRVIGGVQLALAVTRAAA